ncbi:MAG: hypothetical protein GQ475_04230 [Methylococcaceae bacterium]|nr:hypothetical protein [Methylococcaceae bacterium]
MSLFIVSLINLIVSIWSLSAISGQVNIIERLKESILLFCITPIFRGSTHLLNFRVIGKAEGKTKNDYFQDMLDEVLAWGLEPAFVTGDSWYSCVSNLKLIRNHKIGLIFVLERNRLVSVEKGAWLQVQ